MNEKPYSLGLIVGRFQTLHKGHEDIIRRSISLCSRTGILIGSPEECGTENNPFSYDLRYRFLKLVFADAVQIAPLPDIGVGNNLLWGEYVLKSAEKAFGELPDLAVSGKESRRAGWYTGPLGLQVSELTVPKTIDISATVLRSYLLADDYSAWATYVPPETRSMYRELREAVVKAEGHKETKSI